MRTVYIFVVVLLIVPTASATVMNQNRHTLPSGCEELRGWKNITVHGGKEYAKQFPGKMFTYDNRSFQFQPCTKLTVTFVNNDSVRHQWMVHGLPMEIYNMGMFTIEVTGPGRDTGTFILPSYTETLLVHCGLPQHMQKGMKAQIKIGSGDGNLANIPGLTDAFKEYQYQRQSVDMGAVGLMAVAAFIFGALGALLLMRRDRSAGEPVSLERYRQEPGEEPEDADDEG